MTRIINALLAAATIVGLVFALIAASSYFRAKQQNDLLVAATGHFLVEDESKIHVLAVDTGRELDFEWRIYLPEMKQYVLARKYVHGGGSSSGSNQEADYKRMRVRFRHEDGKWMIWTDGLSGSMTSFSDRVLPDPTQLNVRVSASDGIVTFNPEEALELLSIESPKEAQKFWYRMALSGNKQAVEDLLKDVPGS